MKVTDFLFVIFTFCHFFNATTFPTRKLIFMPDAKLVKDLPLNEVFEEVSYLRSILPFLPNFHFLFSGIDEANERFPSKLIEGSTDKYQLNLKPRGLR